MEGSGEKPGIMGLEGDMAGDWSLQVVFRFNLVYEKIRQVGQRPAEFN